MRRIEIRGTVAAVDSRVSEVVTILEAAVDAAVIYEDDMKTIIGLVMDYYSLVDLFESGELTAEEQRTLEKNAKDAAKAIEKSTKDAIKAARKQR